MRKSGSMSMLDRLPPRAALAVAALVALWPAPACRPTPSGGALAELTAAPTEGRNLVVVLSDTHRFDYVTGFPGTVGDPTPNVARLLAEGVAFDNALTPVPISAPAYATLMTGLPPTAHGLLNNQQHLGPAPPLLQEALRAAGYRTAAVVSNAFCTAAHGFGRGFDHYWDQVEGRGKEGEIVTSEAIAWLEANAGAGPFFLFLAYMDAHTPYISPAVPPSLRVEVNGAWLRDERAENAHVVQRYPVTLQPGRTTITLTFLDSDGPATPADGPSPLHVKGLRLASGRPLERTAGVVEVEGTGFERLANRAELAVDLPGREPVVDELVFRCHRAYRPERIPSFYEAGVRSFDAAFGRLRDHLVDAALWDDAVVVFVSDHGEMLGEHGAWGHVEHLWQESLRVPLVVKAPGVAGGRWDSTRLGLADLHDLLLDLALGPDPARAAAAASRRERTFVAATYPPEGGRFQVAALAGGLKVVVDETGAERAFDLEADPAELHDLLPLAADDPELAELLAAARSELRAAAAAETLDLDSLTPDERDRLRALGYLDDGS